MGRYLRWQAAIALLGIVLLAALLRYAAYNFATVTAPDRGGTLVEGIVGSPQYLNPLLSLDNPVDGVVCALLFNGLTRLDEQGNVVPDLAETWRISPDGLTYDFTLRQSLLWHDGAPVRAADALYTIGALQADDFPGISDLSVFWRAVKVMAPDGPDGLAVRFTLGQPLATFLDYTTIGLLPAHLWEQVPTAQLMNSQLNSRPVGTGPFQLAQLSATRAELVANPRYHGPLSFLTGISFRFYPDRQSLLPAYDQGQIDAISWVAPEDMAAASKRADLQLFTAPLSGYALVYLNLQNPNVPFFKETAVRQALMYALDRQALIDTALFGQGIVANTPILPGSWAYDSDVPKYGYDPERARQLLDEADWQDSDGDGVRDRAGKKLAFVLVGENAALIQAMAAAWGDIGVRVAAEPMSMAGLTSDFLVPRRFDAALVQWELSGDPDPYPLWHSTQIKDGQNYAGWDDRNADEAIEKARALTDRSLRRDYYIRFQRAFMANVPALLLYHPTFTYGVRSKVHDVQIGPLNQPADRFRSIANWYIVTRRITIGNQNTKLDSPKQ